MEFQKVKCRDGEVELVREVITDGVTETISTKGGEPLPSFGDAVQAFKSYVVDLLPFLADVEQPAKPKKKAQTSLVDEAAEKVPALVVTTINLSRAKDGRRGLQVSLNYPIAKADNKVVSITTPLVLEAKEDEGAVEKPDKAFALSPEVLSMIRLVEDEATRYVKGDRAQGEIFDASEKGAAAESFNDRSAAAEVASTRKPPKKLEKITDEQLHDLILAKVGKDVPVHIIEAWSKIDRDSAQRYANGETKSMPLCIQRGFNRPKPDAGAPAHVQ